MTDRLKVEPGYEVLASILDEALAQAQSGKGRERHAGKDESFHDQQIVQLGEWMGSTQFNIGQVCKKALESTRLDDAKAIHELRGTINYAAGAIAILQRKQAAIRPADVQTSAYGTHTYEWVACDKCNMYHPKGSLVCKA